MNLRISRRKPTDSTCAAAVSAYVQSWLLKADSVAEADGPDAHAAHLSPFLFESGILANDIRCTTSNANLTTCRIWNQESRTLEIATNGLLIASLTTRYKYLCKCLIMSYMKSPHISGDVPLVRSIHLCKVHSCKLSSGLY
jgi:hypothetical protein